jgi:regulator of sirC expression with transglutaminase-like and TPR domain
MDDWKQAVRSQFAALVDRRSDQIPLAEAAILIGAEDYPGLDTSGYLARIDALAEEIRDEVRQADDARTAGTALTSFLHDRQEFRGNEDDYYDPRNSFLHEVLDRRRGIPITLSILYLEVGARLGLAVRGIGLPGHFLIKLSDAGTYVDPFSGRVDLAEADCADRLRALHGGNAAFEPSMLEPQSNRQILTRVLTNLRVIYRNHANHQGARSALDRLILLNPRAGQLHRERADVLAGLGEYRLALNDVEQVRELQPTTRRSKRFRGWRRFIRQMAERMN